MGNSITETDELPHDEATALRALAARHVLRTADLFVKAALLEHQGHHDDLTKLYNRRFLDKKLSAIIDDANAGKMDDKRIAFMMIDVDDFKKYNTEKGHIHGDKVLKDIACAISESVRSEPYGSRRQDIVARWAGDEFAILWVDDVRRNNYSIKDIAQRVINAQKFPISIGAVSLSGAEIREFGLTVETFTAAADKMLYTSKQDKQARVPSCVEWGRSPQTQQFLAISP